MNADQQAPGTFLDLAQRCANQGTCLRRNFGAIIVDEYNTIVSTGYTGAPRKQMDCTELNRCWRKEHNIPSGSNYERCRSVHAEMNALLQAGKLARGCTLYLAGFDVATGELTQIWPCFLCSKMIVNSGIINVIMRTTPDEYKEMDPMVTLPDAEPGVARGRFTVVNTLFLSDLRPGAGLFRQVGEIDAPRGLVGNRGGALEPDLRVDPWLNWSKGTHGDGDGTFLGRLVIGCDLAEKDRGTGI